MVLFLRLGVKSLAWTPNLSGTGQEAEGVAAYVAVLPVAAVRGLHLNPGFYGNPAAPVAVGTAGGESPAG
jgi:hypothetical protein